MRRARSAGRLVGAAVVVVLGVAACGSDTEEGALGTADETPQPNCQRVVEDDSITRHVTTIDVPQDGLELLGVSVIDPSGVEVIDSVVVRYTGQADVTGTFLRYPPGGQGYFADDLMDWRTRRPVEGVRLSPDDGRQALLVGLRLTDPNTVGTLGGFRLEYADGSGEEYTRDYPGTFTIKPEDDPCTVDDFR